MKTLIMFASAFTLALGAWFIPQAAQAGECTSGLCGTPDQSGGGCGCGCGSILVAMTDRGDTYQFSDDFDSDGIEDPYDNCAYSFNFEQVDSDSDGFGDACDTCASVSNPLQENIDGDSMGDACDPDKDGDLVSNGSDNCELVMNPAFGGSQLDNDGDAMGDACDANDDNDPFDDIVDECPLSAMSKAACDADGACACDSNPDDDGLMTSEDNCPTVFNPSVGGVQPDMDGDGLGDECDSDMDGDLIPNFRDNCFDPTLHTDVANPSQIDADRDGRGDNAAWGAGQTESCDPAECYVVDRSDTGRACLDPNLAFTVQAALLLERLDQGVINVGDQITLALFSNRMGEQHAWSAKFNELPRGSRVTLQNAEGSGTTQPGFPEVANCLENAADGSCASMNRLNFKADAPGTYEIQVTVTLPRGDSKQMGNGTAIATIVAEVGGDAQGGCAAGSTSVLGALALGLLAFVRRRRNR